MIEKLSYGQKFFLRKNTIGKPKTAYIVSNDDDFLVKLSETFPYTPGKDKHFFVHIDKLETIYRHQSEATQLKIFR